METVIKFITQVIHKLDNFDITAKIIFYFFNTQKENTNLSGFLKFIRILFEKSYDVSFLLNILKEIHKQAGADFFSKIVYHFNFLMIFEDNFAFLRKLIKRARQNLLQPQEQEEFVKIFKIWCFNAVSLFSLCVISGLYSLAL